MIAAVIQGGDAGAKPEITLMNGFHPVCLAYSMEKDRYRGISVLVEYRHSVADTRGDQNA